MGNKSFPRWMAPFMGTGFGMFYGLRVDAPLGMVLAFGGGLGLLAGVIVWFMDRDDPSP